MRRKVAKRTNPWLLSAAAVAEIPAQPPQPLEDESLPVAKRTSLRATSFSHAAGGVTTDTPDGMSTVPVTPAVHLAAQWGSPVEADTVPTGPPGADFLRS